MKELKAAASEYPRFEARMKAHDRYDFNDMILWVLKAFSEHEELLLRYQEQFLYMLVDEYQDTSGAQNELLFKLADYWDEPNLFVVGDDDQSILAKFQGANVENILLFQRKISGSCCYSAYRELSQHAAHIKCGRGVDRKTTRERLVNHIPGLSKHLMAANTALMGLSEAPLVTGFPNDVQEVAFIAQQILEARDSGQKPSEIAGDLTAAINKQAISLSFCN